MKAGDLRHRVTIQQRSAPTQNSAGELIYTWSPWATVWAAVEPLQGREYFTAQGVQAVVDTRIRIRYRAGVLPTMRVVRGSRIYELESVISPKERREELHLMCKEIVSG